MPGCLATVPSPSWRVWLRVDAVSRPGDRRDDPRFAEPFAKCRHSDPHCVGEGVRVLIPRPFEEFFGTDDAALGTHQDFEDGELLSGEGDVAAVPVDLAAERVQPQTADLPDRRPEVATPAVERSESQHELPELERLREVIVGTELETDRLVIETVGRGEH